MSLSSKCVHNICIPYTSGWDPTKLKIKTKNERNTFKFTKFLKTNKQNIFFGEQLDFTAKLQRHKKYTNNSYP